MRSLAYAALGIIVVVFGFLFFSSGFGTGANQPATFTVAGALIMLGLVLFFMGIYRRGQESRSSRATQETTQATAQ